MKMTRRRLVGAVFVAQTAFIVVGVFGEFWLMTVFCVWIQPRWIQTFLMIVWLALTLSPLIGLVSFKVKSLQKAYLILAVLTFLFWIVVAALNGAGVLQCDAP